MNVVATRVRSPFQTNSIAFGHLFASLFAMNPLVKHHSFIKAVQPALPLWAQRTLLRRYLRETHLLR
jgi:hypothetical protein